MADIIDFDWNKPQQLQFDVNIKGSTAEMPQVRFCIEDVRGGLLSFNCVRQSDKKTWNVDIPALTDIVEDRKTYNFSIQIIVDDYFFEPVKGTLLLTEDQDFVDVDNLITEASGGPDVTGQVAPTNNLLVPEFPPQLDNSKAGTIDRPEDEDTDEERLFGSDNQKRSVDIAPSMLEQLVHRIMGGQVTKPSKPGKLFAHETKKKQLKETQQQNSDKVRRILNELND